jgi:hypothetical protein
LFIDTAPSISNINAEILGIAAQELARLWECTKARIQETEKSRRKEKHHEPATAD